MKKNRTMALGLAGVLTAALAVAGAGTSTAAPGGSNSLDAPAAATTACASTYTSGVGAGFMSWCLTANGNITKFESPAGQEHIDVGGEAEGYAICVGDRSTSLAYDTALAESGFGPATLELPNGPGRFPARVTRDTSDGRLRLRQIFFQTTYNKVVGIRMIVTSLTNVAMPNVYVTRYVDTDNNNDFGDERADVTLDSAISNEDVAGHALILGPRSYTVPHRPEVSTPAPVALNQCGSPSPVATPTPSGDSGLFLTFDLGPFDPFEQKEIFVQYTRR